MQTFLPYPDFAESAYALDQKRLGKQRVENLQIMQALFGKRLVTTERIFTGEFRTVYYDENDVQVDEDIMAEGGQWRAEQEAVFATRDLPREQWTLAPLEAGWANHPAVKMWQGYAWHLLQYQKAICEEWVHNFGFADTCWGKTLALYFLAYRGEEDFSPPPWLGDENFHISHQSNLLRKDPVYYGKYFPGVPDDLPYVWPV